MHKLERDLGNHVAAGLQRKSVTSCSRWAENYRVMGPPLPGKWTFDHHPWTREMHDCDCEIVVGQKAAQMGFTEWALNRTFYHIDIRGENVIYVLPASTPDASDFSTSRFDPALEMSVHLRDLFTDVKNVGHKRAGNANLFIRGSRSESQLRSIPAPVIIFDEVDVMVQKNITLAFERTSGQLQKWHLLLSTPTIDKFGINEYFVDSTQDHFMFRCPCCSKWTELIFPECLEITAADINDPKIKDSYLKCKECGNKLSHEDKVNFLAGGKWVSQYTNRLSRGFHINQLYSMVIRPWELAVAYIKSLTNPSREQEFWNSKLGLPHIIAGAKITDANIESCTGGLKKLEHGQTGACVVMGVDVGSWLHYEISQYFVIGQGADVHSRTKTRLVTEGKVKDFEELDGLMKQYGVLYCVVDSQPERRKAKEFAQRHWGRVKLCFYGRGVTGKQIHIHGEEEHTITVDRTSWIDLALSRFKTDGIMLPIDLGLEYKQHIKALVRVYELDKDDNPIGRYIKGNEDDHFAHARTYTEMAFSLIAELGQAKDIDFKL